MFFHLNHWEEPFPCGLDPQKVRAAFSHLAPLETPHLLLRRVRRTDAPDLYRYGANPRVTRYVLWDAYTRPQEAREYVRYLRSLYREGEPASLVLEHKADHCVMGTIGFNDWIFAHATAEIGYSLAEPYWGKGLATEAVDAFTRFAWSLGFHRLEAMHDLRNPASGRVLEKCGYTREGVLRGRIYNKGEWCDVAFYACLCPDAPPGFA